MNWNSINFDWNHIRSFLATAEMGTLSAAAKELGLTQPTLSRQMYALESSLKVTLFERVDNRLVLTESGLELLEHAKNMANQAFKLSISASGQSQQLEGLVTVTASEFTATYVLPKILTKIRQEEPGIRVEIVVTNDASDLKRREADIAIRGFHPKQNDLIAKKIGEEVIWLFGSREYLQQFPPITDFADVKDIQVIGFDSSDAVINILNSQGWSLTHDNFSLLSAFQPLQLELCKQGLGLIFMPEELGARETSLAKAFENMGPTMTLPIWLVCHQELRTNLRVKRVFDFIANEYKNAALGL